MDERTRTRIAHRRARLLAIGARVPDDDTFAPREFYRGRPRFVAWLLRLVPWLDRDEPEER